MNKFYFIKFFELCIKFWTSLYMRNKHVLENGWKFFKLFLKMVFHRVKFNFKVGHWSSLLLYDSSFNEFLIYAACPKFVGPFLGNMEFSHFFYFLNLKVGPFKGFMHDLSKIAMLEDISIDTRPGFEHRAVLDHNMTRSWNFSWFWNCFDPTKTIWSELLLQIWN